MAWFGRNTEQQAVEAHTVGEFYAGALAAANSYDVAMERVDEGDVYTLLGKLRKTHLDYAEDFGKRHKKLGGNSEVREATGETLGRTITRIQTAGSIRDLLIAMRQGEENGVAMCREALEEGNLSGKTRSLVESYNRSHIDAIRDLSEQIAVRGTYIGTQVELAAPQWLRFPKAGFWLVEGAILLVGYLFGRSSSTSSGSSSGSSSSGRTSPRAKLGGDQAVEQHGETIAREVNK